MNDTVKRDQLVKKVVSLGLQPGPTRKGSPSPVVSLEDFFEGNEDPGSIACNLDKSDRLSIAEWLRILKEIRGRANVQDVLVEIAAAGAS